MNYPALDDPSSNSTGVQSQISKDDTLLRLVHPIVDDQVEPTEPGPIQKGNGTSIAESSGLTMTIPTSTVQKASRFLAIQEWRGEVIAVSGSSFVATLSDLRGESEEMSAEIPVEEISENERHLLTKGAVFYWSIGYRLSRWGNKERSSAIRFRRLPVWTKDQIEKSRKEAKEWLHLGILDETRDESI